MIRLSLEIPTDYLQYWSPYCDLDFTLAHQVLANERYAKFFASRPEGRELILDNSMHELKRPLPPKDLREAGERCRADYVIAPDQLGEPEKNETWFHETLDALGSSFFIGVVMAGRTREERCRYLHSVREASMLLLPYREDRLSWFLEQEEFICRNWKRVHLLGINELRELQAFVEIARRTPTINWSVDTAKYLKHGIELRRLDTPGTLRGAKLSSYDLLNLGPSDITLQQVRAAEANIQILKTLCNGG